jgi:hypothetical protein
MPKAPRLSGVLLRRLQQAAMKAGASYGKSSEPLPSPAQTTLRMVLGKGRTAAERTRSKIDQDLAGAVETTMVDAVRQAI